MVTTACEKKRKEGEGEEKECRPDRGPRAATTRAQNFSAAGFKTSRERGRERDHDLILLRAAGDHSRQRARRERLQVWGGERKERNRGRTDAFTGRGFCMSNPNLARRPPMVSSAIRARGREKRKKEGYGGGPFIRCYSRRARMADAPRRKEGKEKKKRGRRRAELTPS